MYGYSQPDSDVGIRALLNVLRFRSQANEVDLRVHDPSKDAQDRWRQFLSDRACIDGRRIEEGPAEDQLCDGQRSHRAHHGEAPRREPCLWRSAISSNIARSVVVSALARASARIDKSALPMRLDVLSQLGILLRRAAWDVLSAKEPLHRLIDSGTKESVELRMRR